MVPGSAKTFIDKELFGKLGITNYHWRTAPSGLPESGWEVSVTARDMLKLGLLVSNNGKKHYAFSAQGGGGMYILLVPDFDLVVVVTAHERDDITQQLVAERILPLVARG